MPPPNTPPATFAWTSPTIELPQNRFECVPGVENHSAHYAVRTEAQHKLMQITPYSSKHLEKVDGHDWELFHAWYKGVVDGREYLWGAFVEGLGLFNVMVPVEFARELLPAERSAWSKQGMVMVGSDTGKVSYAMSSGVSPNA